MTDTRHAEKEQLAPDEVDDAFRAVLEGLRTTLPGVQVLFAFLLTLPLQAAFSELEAGARTAFFVAFAASALASALLIAPSAHQRVRAPATGVRRRSERHLVFAVWMTIAGTVLFAVALTAAVYLVTDLVLDSTVAAMAAAAITALVAWAWFYVPLITFERM